MTPENSKVSPELFLCDHCEREMNAGLQSEIDRGKREIDREMIAKCGSAAMKSATAVLAELQSELEASRQEIESLKTQNAAMREALSKAANELNVIRARDGVPWTRYGKSDVCPDYFSSVVDECHAALSTAWITEIKNRPSPKGRPCA